MPTTPHTPSIALTTIATAGILAVTAAASSAIDTARHQVAELTDANRQWAEFDKRRVEAIAHWEQQAAVYVDRLAEAEEAHLAIVQEREWWVWRVTHAEARTPFSLDFLRWADSGVTTCESTDNPKAVNGRQVGLMQIDVPSHEARIARHGYTPADLLRPIPSLIVAESIWREQGAAPWPSCGKRGVQ
jgi:hypothetical protein